jgi:hypothetical protein
MAYAENHFSIDETDLEKKDTNILVYSHDSFQDDDEEEDDDAAEENKPQAIKKKERRGTVIDI